MSECPFCKIVSGERTSDLVFQDDRVTAFHDVRPAATTHILIVPNRHIASINELTPEDETLMGHLFTVARRLAHENGLAESGYRLIINTGPYAGQVIYHIHLHLLGGQRMRHPMG